MKGLQNLDVFMQQMKDTEVELATHLSNEALTYLKAINQDDLNKLLLNCLKHENKNVNYILNVLTLLAHTEKVNFLKIDTTLFKSLINRQNSDVTDVCLQFVDHHRHLFPVAFLKSLTIEIEWLDKYRHELIKEIENDQ